MWKKVFLSLSLLFGIALFVFFIAQFGGIQKTLALVGEVGWLGLAAYVANASFTLIVPAVGWTMLMRAEGMRVPLWTAVKANLMGFPLNFITPSMYLGGEPLKTFYVAQVHSEPKRRVLATIIVGKFQEIGGLLLVMLVAAGISLWRLDFSRQQEVILIGSMAVLTALFGLTLYAFIGNFKPTVKIINALAALGFARRRMARLRARAREMEHLIHQAFTKRWRTFLAAQAVTFLSAVSVLMRPWIYFYFTKDRVSLPVEQLCAIYVVTNVVNCLPLTPGGLGFFEGLMVAVFSAVGIPRENAAAFSVLNRASDLILIAVGSWLIIHYGMQSVARRITEGKEKASLAEADQGAAGNGT
jgi:uncharacterized protein (TIRG00374 family)